MTTPDRVEAARPFDRPILLIAVGASTLGLGMIAALLADLQDRFGFAHWGLGVITASSFVTAFVAYLWFARYADRGRAREMLVIGSVIGAVAMFWIGQASQLWAFVAARALVGLGEGIFVPAARRVVLGWEPDRPGKALGSVLAATVIGFVLGPLLGGILGEGFGLSVPFTLAAAVIVTTLPFVARLDTPAGTRADSRDGVRRLLGHPGVVAGIVLASTEFVSIGALEAVWARLLTDRGASTLFIGAAFTVILLPVAVVSPIAGRVADRYGPHRVAFFATLAIVPLTFLYGRLDTPAALVALGAVQGVGGALIAPAAGAAVALSSPTELVGQGQGLMEAFALLAAALAAAASGWAYGTLGPGRLFAGLAIAILSMVATAWLVDRRGAVAT